MCNNNKLLVVKCKQLGIKYLTNRMENPIQIEGDALANVWVRLRQFTDPGLTLPTDTVVGLQ